MGGPAADRGRAGGGGDGRPAAAVAPVGPASTKAERTAGEVVTAKFDGPLTPDEWRQLQRVLGRDRPRPPTVRLAIYADWQHDTDPYNLQPKVPKFLQEVAAFLRKYPPADTTPDQLAELIATISGRIPRRIDIRLREVFAAEYSGNKAVALTTAIRESGLQPAPPRSPLPPIG